MCKEKRQSEQKVMSSTEAAAVYVRRMIETEARGWGDQRSALERIARRYRVPFWSLNNIRIGRAKTVEAGLYARIRKAYLDMCERQIANLLHEIEREKSASGDDALEDIDREAADLLARLRAAKAETAR